MLAPKINPKYFQSVRLIDENGRMAILYRMALSNNYAYVHLVILDATRAGEGFGVTDARRNGQEVIVSFDSDEHAMEYFLSL